MEYENRYVAFLDVSGFKELVKRSESSKDLRTKLFELLTEAPSLTGFSAPINMDINDWRRISAISDSVVVSVPLKADAFQWLLGMAVVASMKFLSEGCCIRGGISRGSLIHDKQALFGPAFLRAYELETREAIFPRIVIDPEIFAALSREHPGWQPDLVRTDADGWRHVHIFDERVTQIFLRKPDPAPGNSFDSTASIREEVALQFREATCARHRRKWIWFANYFNEYLGRIGHEPMPIPEAQEMQNCGVQERQCTNNDA